MADIGLESMGEAAGMGNSKMSKGPIRGFQKYIDDAMAESNETIISLSQTHDLCGNYIDKSICESLIKTYDILSRQLYNLAAAWDRFSKERKPKTYAIKQFQQPNHSTNDH